MHTLVCGVYMCIKISFTEQYFTFIPWDMH